MKEIKRVVRYTLPGLVFLFELMVATWVSGSISFSPFINGIVGKQALATILTLLFGSGAIGYLLSIIYFALRQIFPSIFVNHLPPLTTLVNEHRLRIFDNNNNEIVAEGLSRNEAWVVLNQAWYALMRRNNVIGNIEELTDRFFDVLHGIGATFVGTGIAAIIWFVSIINKLPLCDENVVCTGINFIVAMTFIAVIILLVVNYVCAKRHVEELVNSVLVASFPNEEAPLTCRYIRS